MGVPLTVMALPHMTMPMKSSLNTRAEGNMENSAVGGAMTKLLRALKRGRVIALVSDRDCYERCGCRPDS